MGNEWHEALRPEQGYPVELVVPWMGRCYAGLRGFELEFGDKPYMTREETSKYTDLLLMEMLECLLVMDAKSYLLHHVSESLMIIRVFIKLVV